MWDAAPVRPRRRTLPCGVRRRRGVRPSAVADDRDHSLERGPGVLHELDALALGEPLAAPGDLVDGVAGQHPVQIRNLPAAEKIQQRAIDGLDRNTEVLGSVKTLLERINGGHSKL